jgi:molecular chaperone HtpG
MSTSTTEKYEFQAEIRQLLDIVINSLYTHREIFLRELVSNAADSLEKFRHLHLTEKEAFDDKLPLEINITTDDTAKTITIQDFGVGMTREELVENIGTIANSGSKKFVKALAESDRKDINLIGQFGVGFYSAFMVAKSVKVFARSWHVEGTGHCWSSEGVGTYEIDEAEGQRRGCKLVLELKDDCHEFSNESTIKDILRRYSSFVPFPINLNGERVNTVQALWLKNKQEVSDEEYTEFYKFQAGAFDEPRYRLHFSADAPLAINSLLFVPKENPERFGFGRIDPSVSLYCKKVLIDAAPKDLLPEWLRFLVPTNTRSSSARLAFS